MAGGWRRRPGGVSLSASSNMAVERAPTGTSLIDVLDRVLDKGIVVDAWVRFSIVGIELITVQARVVVASIETYLRYSDDLSVGSSALPSAVARAASTRAAA